MLIRYRRSEDGRPVAKALVYTQSEHRIEKSRLDPDAARIIERLRENGHEAYIVGGAVRDLLLDRRPKDFDIVTDAQPSRIKKLFRTSRIIGRRFRLVHVYAGPKIFEVSTFRSIANGTIGNEFGTMDEDALRRDFTLNALYYDPIEEVVVDYVGGFKDIEAKRIKPVIPLKLIFKEDPVRMIRCVKYAATTGFRISFFTRLVMHRDAALLSGASPSRLTEEFVKILGSGFSRDIVVSLAHFSLLTHILPGTARLFAENHTYRTALLMELGELDDFIASPTKEKRLAFFLGYFLKPYLESREGLVVDTPEAYQEALYEARLFLNPLNLPRVELEAAVLFVFKKRGISPSQRPRRPGPEGEAGGAPRSRRRRHRTGPGEDSKAKVEATKLEGAKGGGGGVKTPLPSPPGGPDKTTKASIPGGGDDATAQAKKKRRRRRRPKGPSSSPNGTGTV